MEKEKNNKMMLEYEINPLTMIILPAEYGQKVYSEIMEVEDEYISPMKPFDVVKRSCKYYGASYSGRREGTRQLIGITHKAPIIVDPFHAIYLFPTLSPAKSDCIWINHEHVAAYDRADAYETSVTFSNGKSLRLPISRSSFESQFMRTAMLRIRFEQRMQHIEKKYGMNADKRMALEGYHPYHFR
ncbi:competence protein ComK [Bacillus smithii]|uniref:competence protein ComK n=1 Tax=Bacillus smithii TaxID=1479 RepID=UPI0030CA0BB3